MVPKILAEIDAAIGGSLRVPPHAKHRFGYFACSSEARSSAEPTHAPPYIIELFETLLFRTQAFDVWTSLSGCHGAPSTCNYPTYICFHRSLLRALLRRSVRPSVELSWWRSTLPQRPLLPYSQRCIPLLIASGRFKIVVVGVLIGLRGFVVLWIKTWHMPGSSDARRRKGRDKHIDLNGQRRILTQGRPPDIDEKLLPACQWHCLAKG